MSSRRQGFSLVEVLVAMTLTALIGTSLMMLFVSQSKFLDQQAKQEFARGVTRSATNIMMSELRMVDRDSGVVAASDSSVTVRVPFAMGVICNASATLVTFRMFPVDSAMYANGGINGYAYRTGAGYYQYKTSTSLPATNATTTLCTLAGISGPTGNIIKQISVTALPSPAPLVGAPILLYRNVRYHFGNSAIVPGRKGLFRQVAGTDEEIVAPFDSTARFAFFVNDARTAVTSAPSALGTLTGLEVRLHSVNEKPDKNGNYTVVPLTTGVFFKNRRQ